MRISLPADENRFKCADHLRNGEASHADINGALHDAVKAKLDNYQHDYNERNFLFLPGVMTTSGRIRRFPCVDLYTCMPWWRDRGGPFV